MDIEKLDLDKPIIKPIANKVTNQPLPKNEPQMSTSKNSFASILPFVIVILFGLFAGAMLKANLGKVSSSNSLGGANIQATIPTSGVKVGDVYGSASEESFKDKVTGVIDKGGSNGEGTHKLLRPGGATQTVYLTSSVIDLDLLVGSQVTIWGETFKGQKVGWLMDVGRAKIENLNAPLPE